MDVVIHVLYNFKTEPNSIMWSFCDTSVAFWKSNVKFISIISGYIIYYLTGLI